MGVRGGCGLVFSGVVDGTPGAMGGGAGAITGGWAGGTMGMTGGGNDAGTGEAGIGCAGWGAFNREITRVPIPNRQTTLAPSSIDRRGEPGICCPIERPSVVPCCGSSAVWAPFGSVLPG